MDAEGWINVHTIASFNRVQKLTRDYDFVRNTIALSSLLEVVEDKVRLAHGGWERFVLPPTSNASPRPQPNFDNATRDLPSGETVQNVSVPHGKFYLTFQDLRQVF